MEKEQWQTASIEHASIEHVRHPISEFLHRHLPALVNDPTERHLSNIQPGDAIRYADGSKRKLGAIARSAEGTRYAFSDIPLPSDDR